VAAAPPRVPLRRCSSTHNAIHKATTAERTVAAVMVVAAVAARRGTANGAHRRRSYSSLLLLHARRTTQLVLYTYVVGEEVGGGWKETGREVACERDGNRIGERVSGGRVVVWSVYTGERMMGGRVAMRETVGRARGGEREP